MKKSLFALAAMGAFVGAAQAQSSVSVYGIMDGSYTATENQSKTTAAGSTTTVKGRNTVNGDGALSTSRLGFRGVEDLGKGLRAEFVLEYDLVNIGNGGNGNDISTADNATNANAAASGTQSGFGARYSWIGLSDAKLGALRLGRQEQAVFTVLAGMGLAGAANNIAGSIYSAGSTGSSPNSASVRPVTVFLNQAVTYISPNISGVQVTAQYSANAYSAADTTKNNGARETGAAITFSGVKNLQVGYAIALQDVDVAAVTAAASTGTSDTVVGVAAASTKVTQQVVAANYDLGFLRPYINYTQIKNVSSGVVARDQKVYEFGVRAPVTPVVGIWASAFTGKKDTAADSATLTATTTGRANLSGMQLGTTYAFSKRTTAYAIYGQQSVKGRDAATSTEIKSTGYALGLRHTF
jgi:predicted porin